MAQFTTARRVIKWLSKLGDSANPPDAELLDFILSAVGTTVEGTTGREFEKKARTGELYRGDGTPTLYLRHFPVDDTQPFSIWTRASSVIDWTELEGVQYRLDATQRFGKLRLVSGVFPSSEALADYNVRIDSTAGMVLPNSPLATGPPAVEPNVPFDLELAAVLMAEMQVIMQERSTHLLSSESHPDGPSRSWRSFADKLRWVDDTLLRYKLEW